MSDLEAILASATEALQGAADLPGLDQIRVRFLGKKGELTQLLKALGKLPPEERRAAGQAINRAKDSFAQALEQRRDVLQREAESSQLQAEAIDVSLPGRRGEAGGLHPITRTLERIESFFSIC